MTGVRSRFHSQLGAFDLEGKELAILPVVEVLVPLYRGQIVERNVAPLETLK
jgi:hypothetical protein